MSDSKNMSCAKCFLVVIVTVILSLQTLAVPVQPNTEAEVRQYVEERNRQLHSLLNEIRDVGFQSDISDKKKLQLFKNLLNLGVETSQKVKTLKNIPITDPLLKREFDILSNIGLPVLGEEYKALVQNLGNLETLATEKDICSYKEPDNCKLAYIPDVMKIFEKSHDACELEHYWKAWRDDNSIWASVNFQKFIQVYKKAAKLNGKTPTEQWFGVYKDTNFLHKMEDVMKQIKPFYSEFYAYVRNILNRKYGEEVVSADGPIPHHLLEQILIQAWQEDSILDQPFPEKKLPNLNQQLKQKKWSSRRIAEVTDNFFTSLGFPELSKTFWEDLIKKKSAAEAGVQCKSDVFDSTPEVALKLCPKLKFKGFLQLHGDFARIHYATQQANLSFGLSGSYDFKHAVGESAILSASTPKHIKRIDLEGYDENDEELRMNRLFRLGVHTIFQIPQFFVHSKIMAEILEDKVAINKVNKRYWELMEEYAGIQPPVERSPDQLDFPYKFYKEIHENRPTRKFVNEIVGYQFYRALCKISGEYIVGNDGSSLQNCDYYGSHAAGDTLKEMMALGESKPWPKVLAVIIGDEPALNAAALLEFYEPLRGWLQGQNKINNVRIGWSGAKNKVIDYGIFEF